MMSLINALFFLLCIVFSGCWDGKKVWVMFLTLISRWRGLSLLLRLINEICEGCWWKRRITSSCYLPTFHLTPATNAPPYPLTCILPSSFTLSLSLSPVTHPYVLLPPPPPPPPPASTTVSLNLRACWVEGHFVSCFILFIITICLVNITGCLGITFFTACKMNHYNVFVLYSYKHKVFSRACNGVECFT